ncbi:histidine--tRNA ligase [Dethiosulfatarculus sandiegensis]|uniref:histidine--tRNA ligase n=1 Tax=Dethiosulfatarculus sandiegensis TaxID=1429043 RepID=UPI0009EA4294|nr:histidine--tRNA ligase [Dethiosulfatarculus sandiegensis]
MSIQAVRGMKDVLPPEVFKWQNMEKTVREIFRAFGFSEIKIPVLERTELFARSIGETTDIVEKEMYTFSDRSGDSLTMRPEATAGVLRAYVEHKIHAQPGPHKLFAIGPMFRHERPQKGRLRQFNQIDAEILGDESPLLDAELMVMLVHMVESLGLTNVDLHINSLGCSKCRPKYRQALIDFFEPKKQNLCEDCLRRLNANPLRVLDCKVEGCKEQAEGAPVILDHICDECAEHFSQVRKGLDSAGVSYQLDPRMVRGLDYYVRTTFEVVTGDLGAQNAVAGGGRYDGLIEVLGGPPQGGIGFAAGLERLALLAPEPAERPGPALFVAALGEKPREEAFKLVQNLRRKGIWAEMTSQDKSLKAQMRRAGKLDSAKVLILGENELEKGEAVLKNMQDGSQENLPFSEVEEAIG